jgi:hypothetical protein
VRKYTHDLSGRRLVQQGGIQYGTDCWRHTWPVAGTGGTGWGNGGLGTILGPGQFNFDTTIQKRTRVGGIHEDATLIFRTDFFNTFNHAQFANPTSVDVSTTNFGQITSTSVNPRLMQFSLKYVF